MEYSLVITKTGKDDNATYIYICKLPQESIDNLKENEKLLFTKYLVNDKTISEYSNQEQFDEFDNDNDSSDDESDESDDDNEDGFDEEGFNKDEFKDANDGANDSNGIHMVDNQATVVDNDIYHTATGYNRNADIDNDRARIRKRVINERYNKRYNKPPQVEPTAATTAAAIEVAREVARDIVKQTGINDEKKRIEEERQEKHKEEFKQYKAMLEGQHKNSASRGGNKKCKNTRKKQKKGIKTIKNKKIFREKS